MTGTTHHTRPAMVLPERTPGPCPACGGHNCEPTPRPASWLIPNTRA
jgi:hypothetical protein